MAALAGDRLSTHIKDFFGDLKETFGCRLEELLSCRLVLAFRPTPSVFHQFAFGILTDAKVMKN